jgi:hypothetical protein
VLQNSGQSQRIVTRARVQKITNLASSAGYKTRLLISVKHAKAGVDRPLKNRETFLLENQARSLACCCSAFT